MEFLQAASGKSESDTPTLWLLEFDKRFDVFPEFVFYDFKNPMKLPRGFTVLYMLGNADEVQLN